VQIDDGIGLNPDCSCSDSVEKQIVKNRAIHDQKLRGVVVDVESSS
jgi:hypothetical protein